MKKLFLFVLGALTFAACQESLEEKAAREVKMYTRKNCPAKISDTVIMDSLTFEASTHTLHYYYTMTGAADSVGLLNKADARAALLAALRNETSTAAFKEAGYNFAYTYHSQKSPKTILFDTVFGKKDYSGK